MITPQPADPAQRHGGPDAGWYVPSDHGWQRISDGEVRDHGDAAHFMSNPDGRHPSPYASGGIIPQGSLKFGDRVQVYAHGRLYCTHAIITDHGQNPPAS